MIRNTALITCLALAGLTSCSKETPPATAGADKSVEASRQEAARPEYVAVYASDNGNALRPLFDAFEAETGTRVQLVTDTFPALLGKINNPGSSPYADVFLVRSFTELWTAAEEDIFRPGVSPEIAARVPGAFRDAESRWFALATSPRIVAFNPEQVSPQDLEAMDSYGSLADPAWNGKLCLSSSEVPGNLALIALLIQRHGEREAELIVRGLKGNTTVSEFESDESLVDAIVEGRCAVGIVSLREIARRQSLRPTPTLDVYVNIDADSLLQDLGGIGISRHAANPDGAARLVDWLASESPNALHASLGFEFPVIQDAPLSAALRAYESVRADATTAVTLGFFLEDARLLAQRARYR